MALSRKFRSKEERYQKKIEAIPRKEYKCPDCGHVYLMSVGQIICCKHQWQRKA
jgi:rubrerythrin